MSSVRDKYVQADGQPGGREDVSVSCTVMADLSGTHQGGTIGSCFVVQNIFFKYRLLPYQTVLVTSSKLHFLCFVLISPLTISVFVIWVCEKIFRICRKTFTENPRLTIAWGNTVRTSAAKKKLGQI